MDPFPLYSHSQSGGQLALIPVHRQYAGDSHSEMHNLRTAESLAQAIVTQCEPEPLPLQWARRILAD